MEREAPMAPSPWPPWPPPHEGIVTGGRPPSAITPWPLPHEGVITEELLVKIGYESAPSPGNAFLPPFSPKSCVCERARSVRGGEATERSTRDWERDINRMWCLSPIGGPASPEPTWRHRSKA